MTNKIQEPIMLNKYSEKSSFINHCYFFCNELKKIKQETMFFSPRYYSNEKEEIEYFFKLFYKIQNTNR